MKTSSLLTLAAITAVVSVVSSCGKSAKNDAVTNIVWKKNDYASLFKLGTAGKDSFLEVYNNDSSILGKFFWGESDSVSGYRKITKRNRIVSLAAPYSFMLTELGVADRIVGVDNLDYIGHPAWLEPAAPGKDISESAVATAYRKTEVYSKSMSLLPEKLLGTQPDVVLGYWTTVSDQELAENTGKGKIPFVWCQNWLENHPLGRSEWLLAFGWITGTSVRADSIYQQIKKDYTSKSALAKSSNSKSSLESNAAAHRPRVAANVPYPNGTWFLPVKSDLLTQMVADAGGELMALDKDKSLAVTPIEKAISLVKDADIWINIDMYSSGKSLAIDNPQVKSIKAFTLGNVYHYNSVKNNFRNPFWDRGNLYCNEVLADLIEICSAQPKGADAQKLRYYRNAF